MQRCEILLIPFVLGCISKHFALNKFISCPFALLGRPLNGIVGAFSFLEAIEQNTVVAVAILVLDFALSVSLAIQVRVAIKDVAICINPLPADESMSEDSFDYSFVFRDHAASSMGLVIFPISFIQA